MKKLAFIGLGFLMVACGSGNLNKQYANTIKDCLEIDKNGTKYDLKFKAIELSEQSKVTVADSITILTDKFRAEQQLIIDRMEFVKNMTNKLLENERKRRNPHQSSINKYIQDIATTEARIDSLQNVAPDNLQEYENRDKNDVLAVIVRCKYSIVPPGIATTVEETFDFTQSPDGKIFYDKTRVK